MSKGNPLKIAFSNVKGGVGKSTVAEITASILNYEKRKKVLVVDCDEGQYSFSNHRLRDLDAFDGNAAFRGKIAGFYDTFRGTPYPVYESSVRNLTEDMDRILEKEGDDFDLILFDLPGKMDGSVLQSSFYMDYIFSPIECDIQSLEASLGFGTVLRNKMEDPRLMKNGRFIFPLKKVFFFWNKVNKSMRPNIMTHYNLAFKENNLHIMESLLYQSVKFSKEHNLAGSEGVFRSTLIPPEVSLRKGTGIDEFVEKFCKLSGIDS